MGKFDASAIGSDIPRSYKQYIARKFAGFLVNLLGLNKINFFSTEIVQQIKPVCEIKAKFGRMRCKGGHGRLVWRSNTLYSEEPETIEWLESIAKDDYLWDIGANVGLFSVYAALNSKCKVLAVEPEAQNYAILLENIHLNNLHKYIEAANFSITRDFGLGRLYVHAITKGGAYNTFALNSPPDTSENGKIVDNFAISQLQMGVSIDKLINDFGLEYPTHIKIDVDGNEPDIICGASQVLTNERCRSVLVEIQRDLPEHLAIVKKIQDCGFIVKSERSNWESRENRNRESESPTTNMIFIRQN